VPPLKPAAKRDAVTALVRKMIADGTLKPGGYVPFAAELARQAGCHVGTCQRALRALIAEGTLQRGVSPGARLKVAEPAGHVRLKSDGLREALSQDLAGLRRAKGMTQPQLAEALGVSLTAVGHAETGRTWQGRDFWDGADLVLGACGRLLALFDGYQAVKESAEEEAAPAGHAPPAPPPPLLNVTITVTAEGVLITWPGGAQTLAEPPGCQG